MPYIINVFNVKTNGLTRNANIGFGTNIQNSHTANTKFVGGNAAVGDFSPASALMLNGMVDPDISDQGQTANPSAPFINTF
ncbi:spore germination protein [Paenibacillus thalictri]|uniref:Spore germination protein n=1 Tax=Paenibacillus thalictri TaxID=2527873 RepID=A0A4Q9DM99_9BACL|nr:spore germination protein [Paenibacillus thalictri]TBL74610.1 spore germination protein [Paenibacillus thalictri]